MYKCKVEIDLSIYNNFKYDKMGILKQWKMICYLINAIGTIDDSFEIKWNQTLYIVSKVVGDYLTYKAYGSIVCSNQKKVEKIKINRMKAN